MQPEKAFRRRRSAGAPTNPVRSVWPLVSLHSLRDWVSPLQPLAPVFLPFRPIRVELTRHSSLELMLMDDSQALKGEIPR